MNREIGFQTGVAVVQPIPQGKVGQLNRQEGLFTVLLQGGTAGRPRTTTELVGCVRRGVDPYRDFEGFLAIAENPELALVISNTTEAGIAVRESDRMEDGPRVSFPAKLTRFLHHRFRRFGGARQRGVLVLPCELIEDNGQALREAVLRYSALWRLEPAFERWLEEANLFCDTLVDRITPGFPAGRREELAAELGYRDELMVEAEEFHLWIIAAPGAGGRGRVEELFPAMRAGLNVRVVPEVRPYRKRKVRILNGAHTAMVPVGLLCGLQTVRETVEHPLAGRYVRRLLKGEVARTLPEAQGELDSFVSQVLERFANPLIHHRLESIALNSLAKWATRVLPSLQDYLQAQGELPPCLTFSLAALAELYTRGGERFRLQDQAEALSWFRGLAGEPAAESARRIVGNRSLWAAELSSLAGLAGRTGAYLEWIRRGGMEAALERLLG